jgi:hypothetical protein
MGVGTNVQDRAIALHHLDAPWRPADVAQREGRIIRQGNLNEEVQVIRYLTERSFDGYSWQTLERKARFIRDVMSPTLDSREIGDIGDTVLSFSEAKALATNNPLLMDKAEADATLSRLVRAERAHQRNQDTLRRTITRLEQRIATQTQLASDIDTAIARRQDTRGDAFTMTIADRTYRKRIDAGLHLLHILRQETANQLGSRQRTLRTGELGGFSLTVTITRTLGQVQATPALEGAPGAELSFTTRGLADADPIGLITRLENRLTQLEAAKAKALADADRARAEIEHANASLGKPFPQAADLAAAREHSRQIDEQLEAAARPVETEAETNAERPGATVTDTAAQGSHVKQERDPQTVRPAEAPRRPGHMHPPWPSATERAAGPTPPARASSAWKPASSALQHYPGLSRPSRERSREFPSPLSEHSGGEPEAGR